MLFSNGFYKKLTKKQKSYIYRHSNITNKMGGVNSLIRIPIYLSYPDDINIEKIEKLRKKINMMNGEIFEHDKNNINDNIIRSKIILYCITKDSIKNYKQAIDLNVATDEKKKILFIFMDKDYGYNTHPELLGVFPIDQTAIYFEDAYLDATIFKIQSTICNGI